MHFSTFKTLEDRYLYGLGLQGFLKCHRFICVSRPQMRKAPQQRLPSHSPPDCPRCFALHDKQYNDNNVIKIY